MKVPKVTLHVLKQPVKIGDVEVVVRVRQGQAVLDLTAAQAKTLGEELQKVAR